MVHDLNPDDNDPYVSPKVPHGQHVVRYATLSSMDLPLEVRFLIIMIARFADVHGVASVANSTLCEICRTGSHHTIERWISLAADVGILRKEPGKGGKDRRSNSYTFLGADRDWAPLPVGHMDSNPIVALAHARRVIEELLVKGRPVRRPGGGDRPAENRAGAAQERPRQRSLRGDQWGG